MVGLLVEAIKQLNNKVINLENVLKDDMNDYIRNNTHFSKRARKIRNELLNKTDRYILSELSFITWTTNDN